MPTKSSHPPIWQAAFLDNLAETGLVSRAARYAGVTRQTAYLARNPKNRIGTDLLQAQTFAQLWDEALQKAADSVEIEIRQRALEGIEHQRNVYYNGQKVGVQVTRQYSDQLLIFLAQKLRPEIYGTPVPKHAPNPAPCKHCGADPLTEPTPQEKADLAIIDILSAQLLAQAQRAKAQPTQTQPSSQPQSQPASVPATPKSAPVTADTPNKPSFASTVVSSAPEAPFSNSDSSNPPLYVSSDVSSFPEVLLSSFESQNLPPFLSSDVSSSPVSQSESKKRNPPRFLSSPVSSFINATPTQLSKFVSSQASFLAPSNAPPPMVIFLSVESQKSQATLGHWRIGGNFG